MEYTKKQVRNAKFTVLALFVCHGIYNTMFFARLGGIYTEGTDSSIIGLSTLLLTVSIGSLAATAFAGTFGIKKFGLKMYMRMAIACVLAGFGLESYCLLTGNHVPEFAAMFLCGFGFGSVNTGINIAGVSVEQAAGKTLMPRFHSFYSLGAVASTLISLVAARFAVRVSFQFLIIAFICFSVVLIISGNLLPALSDQTGIKKQSLRDVISSFKNFGKDKVLYVLLGLVIASTVPEGVANAWISSATMTVYQVEESKGVTAFAVFMIATTTMRFLSPVFLNEKNRLSMIRLSFIIGIAGIGLFVFTNAVFSIYVAAALWGFGISLGYPLAISLAGSDRAHAAKRTMFVLLSANIFTLCVPSLFGLLGNITGMRYAVLALAVPLMFGVTLTSLVKAVTAARENNNTGSEIYAKSENRNGLAETVG